MTWYRIDTTRLTFREYWHWKPGLPFLFLALKKILGIRIESPQRFGRPEKLVRVDLGKLPARHRRAFDNPLAQSRDLGFELQFIYSVPTEGRVTGFAAALISSDHASLVVLAHSEPENARRPVRPVFSFYTCYADGRILVTSGGQPGLIGGAPEFELVRLRHGRFDQTWRRHSDRVHCEIAAPIQFRGENVADRLLKIVQRNFDYNLERGVWVLLEETNSD
jgi:hypothetical protein